MNSFTGISATMTVLGVWSTEKNDYFNATTVYNPREKEEVVQKLKQIPGVEVLLLATDVLPQRPVTGWCAELQTEPPPTEPLFVEWHKIRIQKHSRHI